MITYILRRLLLLIPLVLAISFLTFLFMHLAPGNFFDTLRMNPQISPETIAQYEARYHFDQPFGIQYLYWLKNLVRGDLGYSFYFQQPVGVLLRSRLWNTFLLSFSAFLVAWCIAIPLGALAAVWRGKWLDRILSFISYVSLSMPGFFLCLLLLYLASLSGWPPLGGMRSAFFDELSWTGKVSDIFQHMLIPMSVLAIGSGAYLFRLMRANMIEVLSKEFIFVLKTRRLGTGEVIFRHALRNAINPLVTLFGMELPSLFSGAALLEIITGWPGLGLVMLQAVRSQDVFLVLGNLVMISCLLVLGNLVADILLVCVDPRIRKR